MEMKANTTHTITVIITIIVHIICLEFIGLFGYICYFLDKPVCNIIPLHINHLGIQVDDQIDVTIIHNAIANIHFNIFFVHLHLFLLQL